MGILVPKQFQELDRGFTANLALVEMVLHDEEHFPPVPVERERVIICSPENVERAVCRALARCREWGQFWKVEVAE